MIDETMNFELHVPNDLLHRLDILAMVLEKDRSEIIVDALRSYLQTVTSADEFLDRIADAYHADEISVEELRLLLDADDLENFHALKQQLDEDDIAEL